MKKWFLRFIGFAAIAMASPIISLVSGRIRMGTDDVAEATIGILTHWGFPIPYMWTAPGLAWAHWEGTRFWANTFLWATILLLAWLGVTRHRRKSRAGKAGSKSGRDNEPAAAPGEAHKHQSNAGQQGGGGFRDHADLKGRA